MQPLRHSLKVKGRKRQLVSRGAPAVTEAAQMVVTMEVRATPVGHPLQAIGITAHFRPLTSLTDPDVNSPVSNAISVVVQTICGVIAITTEILCLHQDTMLLYHFVHRLAHRISTNEDQIIHTNLPVITGILNTTVGPMLSPIHTTHRMKGGQNLLLFTMWSYLVILQELHPIRLKLSPLHGFSILN